MIKTFIMEQKKLKKNIFPPRHRTIKTRSQPSKNQTVSRPVLGSISLIHLSLPGALSQVLTAKGFPSHSGSNESSQTQSLTQLNADV